MAVAAGSYVVRSRDGRYLSRTGRWVKHRNKGVVPGIRRAWAHPIEFILEGGDWEREVDAVVPAEYDALVQFTAITGNVTTISALRRANQARQGEAR